MLTTSRTFFSLPEQLTLSKMNKFNDSQLQKRESVNEIDNFHDFYEICVG